MTIHYGDSKFDLRTRERALREGVLTKQDLESYLKKLPDESKKAEEIPVYEEAAAKEASQNPLSSESSSVLTFSSATEG